VHREVAGRSAPRDDWVAADAGRVAYSTRCHPGGLRSASAQCRAAIPVGGRVGPADANCRPAVPGQGTVAEVRRAGRPAGPARGLGPGATIRCPPVSRARRPSIPPQTASARDLGGRSRQVAARALEAWRERPVLASAPVARIRLLPGRSNRVLSAMRRRGRSLSNLLRYQTTRTSSTLKYQLHRLWSIAYRDQGAPQPSSKLHYGPASDVEDPRTAARSRQTGGWPLPVYAPSGTSQAGFDGVGGGRLLTSAY
jgi:hypothetical protein